MGLVSIEVGEGSSVVAAVRNHRITVDLATDDGGTDLGPSPVEVLTAALGACMGMHIAKYCRAAKLPIKGITLDLDAQIASEPTRVGSVTVDLNLPAGFPENRIEALRRVAAQCTVKNSLKDSTVVDLEIWPAKV